MEQTWKDIYNRKLITAAQAAAMVQNGDSFCAVTREPKTILRELGKRKDLKNVTYYCSQTNFLGELMGLQNEGFIELHGRNEPGIRGRRPRRICPL